MRSHLPPSAPPHRAHPRHGLWDGSPSGQRDAAPTRCTAPGRAGQGRAGDALRCAALRGRAGGGEGSRGRAHRNTRSCRTWGTWMPWRESGAERSRAVRSRAVLCCAPRSARPPPIARGGGGRGGAARLASARSGPARPRSRCDPRAAGPSRGRSERPRPGRERGRGCGCRSGRPYARAPATPHSSGSAQHPPLLPPPRSRPRVNLPLLLIPLRQSAPSLPPQLAQPRHRRLPQAPAPAGPGGRAGAQGILRRVFSGWDNRESQLSSQDDGPDTETLAGDDARDNAVGGGGVREGGTSSPQPARPARSTGPRPPRASLRHFARSPWKRPCQKSLPARRDARGRAAPPGASCAAGARHGGGSEDPRRPSGAEPSAAAPQGRASPAGRR